MSKIDKPLFDKKILITDRVHELLIDGLQERGAIVDYHPKMPYDDVKKCAHDYHGIVINSKVICDRSFLQKNDHLQFISRLGSGLDIIDLETAAELGIPIISTPDGNANAVAEHAMGLLLTLLNRIHIASPQVKNHQWLREANRGTEIRGKTIGVIGVGHTGGYLVEKLAGWRCRVLGHDKYRDDIEQRYPHAEQCDMETLIANADIISLHLPLTNETKQLVDAEWLSKCKKGVILINTSRGGVVDTSALAEALESGHVAGACLDVLENEKLESLTAEQREVYDRLFAHSGVILTPHIAGWTHESLRRIAEITLDKVGRLYAE